MTNVQCRATSSLFSLAFLFIGVGSSLRLRFAANEPNGELSRSTKGLRCVSNSSIQFGQISEDCLRSCRPHVQVMYFNSSQDLHFNRRIRKEGSARSPFPGSPTINLAACIVFVSFGRVVLGLPFSHATEKGATHGGIHDKERPFIRQRRT